MPNAAIVDAIITPRYAIVPTRPVHLSELALTMRDDDLAEIKNLGLGTKKALWRAFRASVFCKTAIVDSRVAAIWGLGISSVPGASPLSDIGVPWLHTSAAIEAIPLSFVKQARIEVAAMRRLRPQLQSYVDASYGRAIKFLRLIGFRVDDAQPLGQDGAPFCRFHMGFGD